MSQPLPASRSTLAGAGLIVHGFVVGYRNAGAREAEAHARRALRPASHLAGV